MPLRRVEFMYKHYLAFFFFRRRRFIIKYNILLKLWSVIIAIYKWDKRNYEFVLLLYADEID